MQTADKKNIAFNFGQNWQAFSDKSLNRQKLDSAIDSLRELIGEDKIKGGNFIDIGCGSGIFAIAASLLGAARVVGIDISRQSIEASKDNKNIFAPQGDIEFFHKSIFDQDVLPLGGFDIVYSWGVLHHTGSMYKAIDTSAQLAKPGSLFAIAIYNEHWSSGAWKIIKHIYNAVPKFVQLLMIWFFYVIMAAAKFAVTGKNPFKKKRGMSFYYDVIDWLGGYPYEYAGKEQIITHVEKLGFKCVKFTAPAVPTGCNEFVFVKI